MFLDVLGVFSGVFRFFRVFLGVFTIFILLPIDTELEEINV